MLSISDRSCGRLSLLPACCSNRRVRVWFQHWEGTVAGWQSWRRHRSPHRPAAMCAKASSAASVSAARLILGVIRLTTASWKATQAYGGRGLSAMACSVALLAQLARGAQAGCCGAKGTTKASNPRPAVCCGQRGWAPFQAPGPPLEASCVSRRQKSSRITSCSVLVPAARSGHDGAVRREHERGREEGGARGRHFDQG